VKLEGEPDVKMGKDGPYAIFNLIDENCMCWSTFVNGNELMKALEDISYSNGGILAGKKPAIALNFLERNYFDCWTLITEKGKVATYFNKDKFSKRQYVLQLEKDKRELNDIKAKEREDNKARMAEEAELTKKANEDKAPF
jgi:hypothetical protein